MSLTRRAFMASVVTVTGSRLLSACRKRIPVIPPLEGGLFAVDAHCHVFNGSDLSVVGFLERVVFRGDAIWTVAARNAAVLIARHVQNSAPDAQSEVGRLRAEAGVHSLKTERGLPDDEEIQVLLEGVAASHPVESRLLVTETDRSLRTFPDWARRNVPRHYLQWFALLTRFRFEIMQTLLTLYGIEEGGVALFMPATVDMAMWLDDEPRSPMAAQSEVMSLVVRSFPGRVLPFVGFDPRRALGNPDAAFFELERAVGDQGFAGVKLYPPMGFSAEQNWVFRPPEGEDGDFGDRLDNVLARLFEWCEGHQVPIMAHCNDSVGAGPEYSWRAHPRFWKPVLEKHPSLRLNFAHFGGMGSLTQCEDPTSADCSVTRETSWTGWIVRLMERFEHVYADVGHFHEITLPATRELWMRGLAALAQAHPILLERLLYGSDWHMPTNESAEKNYFRDFRAAFEGKFSAEAPGLMRNNALQYLGLSRRSIAASRIERFYRAHKMPPPDWLPSS